MSPSPTRWGFIVFALGILLLLGVFALSYAMFTSVAGMLEQAENNTSDSLPPISGFLAVNAIKLGFLIIMGYISSLIAGKGIHLLTAGKSEVPASSKAPEKSEKPD